MILESPLLELGLAVINFCYLFLLDYVMLSSSSAKLSSLKYKPFFVTLTLWLRFITVGGSWLPVIQTSTLINLPSHHFQPFCSKDENVLNPLRANPTKRPNTLKQFVGKLTTNCLSMFHHFLKDCNHILIWRLTLVIAWVKELGPGGKINEDFCFKPLYNLHNSVSYFIIKNCSNKFFDILNSVVGDLSV